MKSTPQIRLSGYIGYIATRDSQLRDRVRKLRDVTPYSTAKDYWRLVRIAVVQDRRTTRDGRAMHAAAINARRGCESNFERIAEAWTPVARRWRRHHLVATDPAATVNIGGTDVMVRPTFVERDSTGKQEVVLVRFSVTAPLDIEKANKILRLAQRAYPDDTIVLVDLPGQGKVYSAVPTRDLSRYDEALERDGLHIASILAAADDVA